MPWPLSQDYNEAIQSPALCFNDPELKQARSEMQRHRPAHALLRQLRRRVRDGRSRRQEMGGQVLHPTSARPAGAVRRDQRLPEAGQLAVHGGLRLPRPRHQGARPVVSGSQDGLGGGVYPQRVREAARRQSACAGELCAKSGCAWLGGCGKRGWRTATSSTATSCWCRAAKRLRSASG